MRCVYHKTSIPLFHISLRGMINSAQRTKVRNKVCIVFLLSLGMEQAKTSKDGKRMCQDEGRR